MISDIKNDQYTSKNIKGKTLLFHKNPTKNSSIDNNIRERVKSLSLRNTKLYIKPKLKTKVETK